VFAHLGGRLPGDSSSGGSNSNPNSSSKQRRRKHTNSGHRQLRVPFEAPPSGKMATCCAGQVAHSFTIWCKLTRSFRRKRRQVCLLSESSFALSLSLSLCRPIAMAASAEGSPLAARQLPGPAASGATVGSGQRASCARRRTRCAGATGALKTPPPPPDNWRRRCDIHSPTQWPRAACCAAASIKSSLRANKRGEPSRSPLEPQ